MTDNRIQKKDYRRTMSFKSLARLMSYLFAYKWQMIVIILGVIISTVTQIWGVNMLQPIIDNHILKGDVPGLKTAVIQMGFIYLVSAVTSLIYSRLMVRVGERSIRNIRRDLFDKIQTLPVRFFDNNQHGEIMSRFTNDTDVLSQALANTVPTIIRSLLTFFGTIIVMFKLDFSLTLSLIIGLLVMIPILSRIVMRTGRYFAKAQANVSKLHGFNEEMLSGQKVVKVFSREK